MGLNAADVGKQHHLFHLKLLISWAVTYNAQEEAASDGNLGVVPFKAHKRG